MARPEPPDKNVKIRELTVAADESQLSRVRDFIVDACEEAAFSERETSNTKLAVDEACTNIMKHAYDNAGEGEITVSVSIKPGDIKISLADKGKKFDYASVQDPNLDEYVETGRKGGLGIYLINRLMDGVEYRASDAGNELILAKRSQSAVTRGLVPPAVQPFRGTLRFKFMLRATSGLLMLVLAIWAFVFIRQTTDIGSQRATQWLEKRRLAENLANRSSDALIRPEEFSVEQTNLSSSLAKFLNGNDALAYVRVVDKSNNIIASGIIDEIFTAYLTPPDAVELTRDEGVVWRALRAGEREVRDIQFPVRITNPDTGAPLELGAVHLGIFNDAVEANIDDPRLTVTIILFGVFLVGLLLIMGLVSVFVKPIQVLTDGVRAIGDGSLDAKLDIGGPAEIGAIAGVFNEITAKFKRAQVSVLEQEKMQKEMEVAKEIQQSLLPRHKPRVSGYDISPLYQAAAEVGGDYYDFVDVDEDTIGVVVADVSGKGVPGSLVMTMIRTALRMEARGNKNASDVMSKMNAFVTDDMKKGMFVTMFYVILDSKNRIISYASAGHNPMILYRHETSETFFLNPKGFPVGISLPDESLFRKSISLEKIKLKKDDMLLIYTDGVTEAMNERREQYGEQRLLYLIKENGHLHPENFISVLDRDIKKFTGGYPQNDDITVVAVKEKQSADDVLFGIRKKLIDLVEIKGLGVKEACAQMKVSPATYYRYKKRLEVLGERGLKNKVLRQDTVLKRVSLEARKEMLDIIIGNPEFGAKRIATEYNAGKEEMRRITERMVYDELKRLNLNTRDLRLEYLRRNRLVDPETVESGAGPAGKGMVEDLLRDIPGVESRGGGEAVPASESDILDDLGESGGGQPEMTPVMEFDSIDGVGLNITESEDGVTSIEVNGHLDSVTSAVLEEQLKQLITDGRVKFIVDLSDVTYISSGGWGIFTGEVRHLRESGGDVVLAGMSPEVYDVYELLGFNEVIKAFPTNAEGHAFFELPPEDRIAMPSAPASDPGDPTLGIEIDDEEVPGESYVPEWESLRIEATTVGSRGDIAVVSLQGIIDTVSAENLRAALARVITSGRNKIVVDMSQVEYVSSGGWGTFTERLREVRRNSGDIKLFGMDPDVYYVFTMLGFNIVLSSFDILSEAIGDFESGDGQVPEGEIPEPPAMDAPTRRPASSAATPRPMAAQDVPDIDLSDRDVERVVRWEDTGDGILIAHLTGYIESAAVDVLTTSMMQKLSGHPLGVLFDLEDVDYISSTGWGQFARCNETVRDWGGTVALYGLGPELHEIYSCLEFGAFIKAYPGRVEAVAAVKAGGEAGRKAPDPKVEPVDITDLGAIELESPGSPIDPEWPVSIDDILGYEDNESSPEAAGPAGPQLQRWPGEAVFDEEAEAPFEPAADAGRDETAPAEEPASGEDRDEAVEAPPQPHDGRPYIGPESDEREPSELDSRFVDISDRSDSVDVESAVADKNIDQDESIRKIGWGEYGDRLKKRNKPRKNKKD